MEKAEVKRCLGACGEELSLDRFSAHKAMSDGKRTRCKRCISGEERERRRRLDSRVLVVDENSLKVCNTCGEEKTLKEFRKRSDSPDGRRGQCEACFRDREQKHYQQNKERINLYRKQHYQQNKERYIALSKNRYEENKEEINKKKKQYYEENREQAAARMKVWHEKNPNWRKEHRVANPDLVRDQESMRRAKRYTAYVEPVNRWILFEVYKGCCGICGEAVERDSFEVDHIIPLSKGGLHMYTNMQPSHRSCNAMKNDKIIDPDQLAIRVDPKVYEDVPRELMSMRTALSGIWWEERYKNPKNI